MHSESPSVYHLPVHLENQQLVYYNADDDVDEVLGRETLKKTPLTEWFKANETYPEARNTAYQDFPKKWVYVKQAKKWKPRECVGLQLLEECILHPLHKENSFISGCF